MLDDDTDGTLPTMQTFTNFVFSTYTDTVTETAVAHFTTSLSCTALGRHDHGHYRSGLRQDGSGPIRLRTVSYLADIVIFITALSQTQLAPAALSPVAALFSPAEAQAHASFLIVHSLTVTNLGPGIA